MTTSARLDVERGTSRRKYGHKLLSRTRHGAIPSHALRTSQEARSKQRELVFRILLVPVASPVDLSGSVLGVVRVARCRGTVVFAGAVAAWVGEVAPYGRRGRAGSSALVLAKTWRDRSKLGTVPHSRRHHLAPCCRADGETSRWGVAALESIFVIVEITTIKKIGAAGE